MEEINLCFHQRKADQSKLEDQTVRCNRLMAEVTTFQEKFVTFRQEIPDAKCRAIFGDQGYLISV